MITFDFYTPLEKVPNDGDEIVYLERATSFNVEYFNVKIGIVEYVWEELDDDYEFTGNSLWYSVDHFQDNPNVILNVYIDGQNVARDFFEDVFCWNYPFEGDTYGM